MAGIAGIYCADGRPADVAELERMVATVEHRGPDGIAYWNSGPVAFAHLQFRTTPESLDERQPLLSPGGEACLVWNGRVDNREELLAELAAAGAVPVDLTDPGLALAAYLAWDAECVQHIIGDFALAIWDQRHRRLWCARDYIGIRPFYYFWDGKTFLFGPEIRALLAHPLVSLRINEGMVGEYLADELVTRDETLYTDIRRLPGGCTLVIDSGGAMRTENWWKPELGLIHYKSDEEYAEHFRALFDQAVRAQLRSNAPVGVAMSGGLDSTSVAVTAQILLRRTGETDRLRTFSVVSPGKAWDESEDIAAVVGHAGLQSELLEPLDLGFEHYRQRAAEWREPPSAPNGEPMVVTIAKAAKRCGISVILNGIGGDEWLGGSLEHLNDLAFRGRIRELMDRGKSDWALYSGSGYWGKFVLRRLLAQSAPRWVWAYWRKHRLAGGLFSREFLKRTRLAERLVRKETAGVRHFSTRAQRATFAYTRSGLCISYREWNDRDHAANGLEPRFPFDDRRLVEFCLRLPEEQRQRGTLLKWLLRTAMRGRLPEQIQRKRIFAEFSNLFATVIHQPQGRAQLEDLTMLRQTDWLDPVHLREWGHLPPQPSQSFANRYGRMWAVLAVDLWLESLLAGQAEDTPELLRVTPK